MGHKRGISAVFGGGAEELEEQGMQRELEELEDSKEPDMTDFLIAISFFVLIFGTQL